MKKISTENLVLELTRRCNMKCPHCLRGDCQNYDMTFETAKTAIDRFEFIEQITFSGGEPTLCGDIVCKIVDYIIENNVKLYGFYMASNGLNVNMQIMIALAKLYGYINQDYDAEETCFFDISVDQYHEIISKLNKRVLDAFRFVNYRGEIPDGRLINEGRAYENGIGARYMNHKEEFNILDEDYNGSDLYNLVYVNAKGNITPCCDLSYKSQDSLPLVNISEGEFNILAKRYNEMLCNK